MRMGEEEGVRGRNPIRVPSRRVTGDTHTNETKTWGSIHVPVVSAPVSEGKMYCLLSKNTPKALKPHKGFVLSKTLRMAVRIKIPLKLSLLFLLL